MQMKNEITSAGKNAQKQANNLRTYGNVLEPLVQHSKIVFLNKNADSIRKNPSKTLVEYVSS